MKYSLLLISVLLSSSSVLAQWKPAGDRIKTTWGENLNPQQVLPEYPRPLLERPDWQNLNGLWELEITPVNQNEPKSFGEKILVPFAVESSLSGLQRRVDETQAMWYRKTFTVPASWQGKNILLHFGAVDWQAEVFVNGIKIGSHTGGYTPFSFDITPFLNKGSQELVVKVWDPVDKYFQPHGKQVSKPDNIVYTPVSGIWQTVWLEPVNEKHIASLKTLPDVDNEKVIISVNAEDFSPKDYVEAKLLDGNKVLSVKRAVLSEKLEIPLPGAKLWSPDSPFLYGLEISLFSDGKVVDKVKSYCAMRKISATRGEDGFMRIQLNNKDIFQFGLLDQGWYPDGLYTAPSDEALVFDILKSKELGYNMLRKHVKVELARWYYHCDRLGMLVWQDMPSGDNNWNFEKENLYWDAKPSAKRNPAHENYFKEWKEIIDCLYSYPSIVMWIPFNEGWGQFRSEEVAEWTKAYDPSRLLNIASGGNYYHLGDVLDMHHYPEPKQIIYDASRVAVIGEYGGIGYSVEGHLWQRDKNFGYVEYKTSKDLTDKYIEYAEILKSTIKTGISAAVYTQVSDVEGEVNGIFTYDRKVVKPDKERISKVNREICHSLDKK